MVKRLKFLFVLFISISVSARVIFISSESNYNTVVGDNITFTIFNDTNGISRFNASGATKIDFEKIVIDIELYGKDKMRTEFFRFMKFSINSCEIQKHKGNYLLKTVMEGLYKYSNYKFDCPQKKKNFTATNFEFSDANLPVYILMRDGAFWQFKMIVKGLIKNQKSLTFICSLNIIGSYNARIYFIKSDLNQVNTAFIENATLVFFNDTNGLSRVNFTGFLVHDVQKLIVDAEVFVRRENEKDWRKFISFSINQCDLKRFKSNAIIKNILENVKKYSNYEINCPQPKNFYYLTNFEVSDVRILMFFRNGFWNVKMFTRGTFLNRKGLKNIVSIDTFGSYVRDL
ncbi:hypothetical protein PVAND_008718 [Polypedilum vanderplanki]|uniref:Uncharacterized protein n=1 Tax=Polypedilum vanderplanki TaxID=319348 RepID=A0A9J6CBX8_POLVA|nr:hypothetical protein PVAND_008718 [Polypedilum vanderplanki]